MQLTTYMLTEVLSFYVKTSLNVTVSTTPRSTQPGHWSPTADFTQPRTT